VTATREQSSGIGQVGTAVQELDHATQQNAALVEQTAAATSCLLAQRNGFPGKAASSESRLITVSNGAGAPASLFGEAHRPCVGALTQGLASAARRATGATAGRLVGAFVCFCADEGSLFDAENR